MKVVCCGCNAVLKPGTGKPTDPISHGYCVPCYFNAMADVDLYFARLEKEKAGGVGTGQDAKTPLARERMIA